MSGATAQKPYELIGFLAQRRKYDVWSKGAKTPHEFARFPARQRLRYTKGGVAPLGRGVLGAARAGAPFCGVRTLARELGPAIARRALID